MFILEKHYPGHRDLACHKRDLGTRENVLSYTNAVQLFILFSYQGEISLVNLDNLDN